MSAPLQHWKDVYNSLKESAVCIDIERMRFNGPIAVVGWWEPHDGPVECNQFIRGRDLTFDNLQRVFQRYKLLITFNGVHHDIPAIEREFPGVFRQGRQVLDLYLLARRLRLNAGLKTLENTFGIERLDGALKRGRAIALWKRYEQEGDRKALDSLLAYNKQDTVNLYPLAEHLVGFIGKTSPTFLVEN